MDLISQLPNHILHMLLDYHLPRKDAAQTSVLSKTWRAINYGSPFLYFDERDFMPKQKHSITTLGDGVREDDSILLGDFNYGVVGNGVSILHPRRQNLEEEEAASKKESHDLFMNYIESRISSLLQHESTSPIEQFHLTFVNFDHQHDSSSLDLWLKHAFERRVSNLILTVFTTLFDGQKEVVYSLPSSLFVSQTLTELKLANCKLELLDGAAGNIKIKLPRLRDIHLSNLDLDDDFLKCLIVGCPLLGVMVLSYCLKLSNLQVTTLPRLERVVVRACPNLECLNIQSPELQYFHFHGCHRGKTCNFRLITSNVIKQMVLSMIRISGAWLQRKIVKCEELILIKASDFEDTKLSSQKLRYLTIHHCYVRKMVEIDCPNLYSLNYFENWLAAIHCVYPSELRRMIFQFSLEDYRQHTSLPEKLKEYFGNVAMLGEVKAQMPKAKLTISSLDVEDLVDHFCANSRNTPHQTLNIISTQKSNNKFSQVLYDELSRIKENANCCEDGINQCWRHKLSNVMKDSNVNDAPALLRFYQSKYYQISRILLEREV
ncbi:hypothetical protein L6164_003725 [Bauhinia variegata]|uniref:Uncharacterized protein n=1 Tax=Bauhinia variegata TaxID=167791 RepID=A0ACB9Q4W7_BAUVA|nr:hypothetical protein L6164_003725 [Bauhinia variegata]